MWSVLGFGGDFGFGAVFGLAARFFLGDGGSASSTSVRTGSGVGARSIILGLFLLP